MSTNSTSTSYGAGPGGPEPHQNDEETLELLRATSDATLHQQTNDRPETLVNNKDDPYHRRMGFSIALCNAVDAVETTAFGSILITYVDPDTGKRLDETPELSGLLTSGVFLGMLVGGLGAGFAADKFGRRPVLLASMIVNALSALLSSLCPNFPGREVYWLLFFRILAGLGVGGSVPCAFSLTAEWSAKQTRGYNISLLNASWMAGSIFTAFAAWILLANDTSSQRWPAFLFVCSWPAFLAYFMTKLYVTDAPRPSVSERSGIVFERSKPDEPVSWFNSKLLIFAIIWFAQSFGSYGVTTWIGDVFHELGYKDPFLVALAFAIASIPGIFIAMSFVERLGRKFLLGLGMMGSGVSAIIFSARDEAVVAVISACLFSVFVTLGWVGLGVMSTETFPYEKRTTSMGVAAAFGRIGSVTANLVNPFLLKNNMILGVAGAVLIAGGCVGMSLLDDLTGRDLDR